VAFAAPCSVTAREGTLGYYINAARLPPKSRYRSSVKTMHIENVNPKRLFFLKILKRAGRLRASSPSGARDTWVVGGEVGGARWRHKS